MRPALILALLLGALTGTLNAQVPCDECGAACYDDCAETVPCPRCCRAQAQAQAQAQALGAFAAPPPTGEVAGESQALGIRGLAIRFPEMHLQLPTLQLPSLVHYRRDAEAILDHGHAPLVSGAAATYGMISPGGHALAATAQNLVQPGTAGAAGAACDSSGSSRSLSAEQPLTPPPAPPAEDGHSQHRRQAELRAQLAQKEAELIRLQQQFQQLDASISRLRNESVEPASFDEESERPHRTRSRQVENAAEGMARCAKCQKPVRLASPPPSRPQPSMAKKILGKLAPWQSAD